MKYTEDEIRGWALTYIQNPMSLKDLEEEFEVPDATIWWCFVNRLRRIDILLHYHVKAKLLASPTGKGHGGIRDDYNA